MALFQGVIKPTGSPIAKQGPFMAPVPVAVVGTWRKYTVNFIGADVTKAFVLATAFAPENSGERFSPIPVSYSYGGTPDEIEFMVGDKNYGLSFRVETSAEAQQRSGAEKRKPAARKKK